MFRAAAAAVLISLSSLQNESQNPVVFLGRSDNAQLYGLCSSDNFNRDLNRVIDFTTNEPGATGYGPYWIMARVNHDNVTEIIHQTKGADYGWIVGLDGSRGAMENLTGRYHVSATVYSVSSRLSAEERETIERVEAFLRCPPKLPEAPFRFIPR